ncbi:MAG: hypothetical protein WCQ72_01280 [Eubacteriales bacterium]
MGFGTLFIGHILLFFCRGIDVFPDIIAYAVIFAAIYKLSAYDRGFMTARRVLIPLMALSAAGDALDIISAAKIIDMSAGAWAVISNILTALLALGMLCAYWFITQGVIGISREVGRAKITASARRNIVLTIVYVAAMAVFKLNLPFMAEFNRYFGIVYLLLGLAWVILYGTMFFSCYMWICLEGDEDMPDDATGFLRKLSHPPKKQSAAEKDGGAAPVAEEKKSGKKH